MDHRSESRDSIADIWGPRTPQSGNWPVRVDEHTAEQPDRWVQSACVLCANGCGLDIGVKDGRIVGVRGRQEDAVNRGRLGPKGLHGWQANASADRLTRPLIRRGGVLQEATWDEAMELIVVPVQGTGSRLHGQHSGLLSRRAVDPGGALHAGADCAGRPGNDAPGCEQRLCTATAETALRESFGTDGQPGCYEDFDVAEVIFHIGHNVAFAADGALEPDPGPIAGSQPTHGCWWSIRGERRRPSRRICTWPRAWAQISR